MRAGKDDSRFVDYCGATYTSVTSGAGNESGMFETALRDERFLPFAGAGATNSVWRLQLPGDLLAFDYTAVFDAVLHLRYPARPAGDPLAGQWAKELLAALKSGAQDLALFFLLRNDFPTEWSGLRSTQSGRSPSLDTAGYALRARKQAGRG